MSVNIKLRTKFIVPLLTLSVSLIIDFLKIKRYTVTDIDRVVFKTESSSFEAIIVFSRRN